MSVLLWLVGNGPTLAAVEDREGDAMDPAIQPDYSPYHWPDDPPADCPVNPSTDITGILFTGRYANYTGADTWYPTWAPDGDLYSCWTDGYIWTNQPVSPYQCKYCGKAWGHLGLTPDWGEGKLKPYHGESASSAPPTCTGQARITGDDPLNLDFVAMGKLYSGPNLYPCVSVIAKGVFYIGTYEAYAPEGPFNGFRHSKDWNHWAEALAPGWSSPYWTDDRTPGMVFFAEDREPRRFRVPHAVVFGRNNELSPDGKIYMTAHGAVPGGKTDWNIGDAVYLCRVAADPAKVKDPTAYEFFADRDEHGLPLWLADITRSKPILEWKDHLGSEGLTFVPGLKKYILMTARLADWKKETTGNTLIFWEANEITGPYRLVHHLRDWGPATYFPNIPAKFISTDGQRAWLCVASNFRHEKRNPYQCRYAASLHEIVFEMPNRPLPLLRPTGRNLALDATAEASSCLPGSSAGGVNDGAIDGLGGVRGEAAREWASNRAAPDAWVKLTWPQPVTVNRLRLYDRPNPDDRVLRGTLTFSDGSTEQLRAWLSNSARSPGEVSFSPREVTWVRFTVDQALGKSPGLAEFEVYSTGNEASPGSYGLQDSAMPGLLEMHDRSRRCVRTCAANGQTHHADVGGKWNGTWLNDLYFGQRGGLYVSDEREQQAFLSELRKVARHVNGETGFVPYTVSPDGTQARYNKQGMDFDRRCEFVLMVVRAYEVTGEEPFAREMLPLCRVVLDRLREQNSDGDLLLEGRELAGPVKDVGSCASVSYIGDTAKNDWKDFGASLFLYDTMTRLAKLEECLGDEDAAAKRREQAEAVAEALRRVFWNGTNTGFTAWIERDGNRHDDWITGNNCHAIACGAATPKQAESILDYLEHNRKEIIDVVPGRVRIGLFEPGVCSNPPHDYWNGGIWPLVTGPMMIALAKGHRWATLADVVDRLANKTEATEYGFNEAYDGVTGKPAHVPGLLMNNGGFLWGVFEGLYGLSFDGDDLILRKSVPAAALPASAVIRYRSRDLLIRWSAAKEPALSVDGMPVNSSPGDAFRFRLPELRTRLRSINVQVLAKR